MNKIFTFSVFAILLLAIIVGLNFNKITANNSQEPSKSQSTSPNYSVVFPNDKVNRIDITLSAQQWEAMNADLTSNMGASRGMQAMHPEGPANDEQDQKHERPKSGNRPPMPHENGDFAKGQRMKNDSSRHSARGRRPGPPGGHMGGPASGEVYQPAWSYCAITFNQQQWSKVGIRFKGNSSLRSTYQRGLKKFSFKLDFDQFEDEFPEIKNQRFYGIKQLNLKNNFGDPSFIREKVASDLFAEFGLTSPKTSFCEVYVDYGEGPQYFGVYTLVEEVDDTVVKTQYSGKKGNLYKPEGFASTFTKGSFDKDSMHKKNNKKSDDFSDVKNLNKLLNSSLRIDAHEQWKTQLNEIFDVDIFLKWLAANEVMQNWDTYGNSTHNYFLYNNTTTGKLEWIPWDNNEALQFGKRQGALPLSLNTVDENWPLIRYIIDDEEWNATYENYLSLFVKNIYSHEKITSTIDKYKELIESSVVGDKGEQKQYSFLKNEAEFYEAIDFLKNHASERQTVVDEFLGQQNI